MTKQPSKALVVALVLCAFVCAGIVAATFVLTSSRNSRGDIIFLVSVLCGTAAWTIAEYLWPDAWSGNLSAEAKFRRRLLVAAGGLAVLWYFVAVGNDGLLSPPATIVWLSMILTQVAATLFLHRQMKRDRDAAGRLEPSDARGPL